MLYDEIRMITSANLKTDNDLLFINILNHKLDISPNSGTKKLPIRNAMNMSTFEYREFLSAFQYTNKWMTDFMSAHIKEGIKFPYKPDEIITNFLFREGTMHITLDVENDFALLLEEDFWVD